MKKNYEKPQIRFESFELSQNISANCDWISNQAEYVCPVVDPEWDDITIFMAAPCDTDTPLGDDGICYDVPTSDTNIFSS